MAVMIEKLQHEDPVILKEGDEVYASALFLSKCFRRSVQWLYVLIDNGDLTPADGVRGPHGELMFPLIDALREYDYYKHAHWKIQQREDRRSENRYHLLHPDEEEDGGPENPDDDDFDYESSIKDLDADYAELIKTFEEYTDFDLNTEV